MEKRHLSEPDLETGFKRPVTLPPELERLCIAKFDLLVSRGELIYESSTAETIEDQGFKLNFRYVPHLKRKPITPADAPERKTGTGHDPFLNPPEREVVSSIGEHHTLLVNKFSVYRPSLVLITREFAPQTDDLNAKDLTAAWAILLHFRQPYMMIYNCGFESGSSQGHKHMQLWPVPHPLDLGFELFPNQVKSVVHVESYIPKVPHMHFVLRIPDYSRLEKLEEAYEKLRECVRESHRGKGTDYNVILVKEWMCMIPRRHSGLDRGAGANSAMAIGLVWIQTDEEKEVWMSKGPVEYLKYLGIPR